MTDSHRPGLLVLHGNRLELLADAVFDWLAAHPLPPLEQETLLVQSNGMAEWLKMALAGAQGICAAARVELPARFVWRAYRAVLGRAAVPVVSALDKLPLTWRLMHLLPQLAGQPGFEPVAAFLGAGDAARRLQLAQRLADLLDQYQVYRSDWLQDWATGHDVLRSGPPSAAADAVPPDQRWQAALWRRLQQTLTADERQAARAALHRRFIDALQAAGSTLQPYLPGIPRFPGLPQRIVLFGTTHIPHQTLEAIAALAAHCQVLLAVPNPCRYHWADIIDGRELLRAERRRQALRGGCDLSTVPLQDMHAHGHPLLAAWGRQGRDFVRQLDAFDDVQAARQRFALPRVDLFDDAPGSTLLQQVQAAIRELLPLAEHARQGAAASDRSIVFQVAHSAQREVEILHDQLLHLLAQPPEAGQGRPLQPRDIVVMVPDIDGFAPAIRSVFGQHAHRDARFIPWGIADQQERGRQPLLVALEWLLRAPQQRFGASEVRGLLDVPALALRFGIAADDLPTLLDWIDGAGIRWGLDAAQRAGLGLSAGGAQNTWVFGLQRMLLGYAAGALPAADGFAGIEPYAEVAGLGAGLAGALADVLRVLGDWWRDSGLACTPGAWARRLRQLLADVFQAGDDAERATLAALDDALATWLQACEAAAFDDVLPLAVAREAWLDALDAPGGPQRFKAGGVTFCTLLPLRAIPFEVVCLLGMNDGDYPRRSARSDFDLMALPGQARPGDRSRRDDDRQLMLDALLSARRVLSISWCGRSQRDNQPQPPSVLVSQLLDYLAAGWGADVVAQRTTEHPLQPFSRRYFEARDAGDPSALRTFASEWRAAHVPEATTPAPPAAPGAGQAGGAPVDIRGLAAFLRNPVKAFFRHRLQVVYDELPPAVDDDEVFGSQGLDRWSWADDVLAACRARLEHGSAAAAPDAAQLQRMVAQEVARLQRAGRLPLAAPGARAADALAASLLPMVLAWRAALAAFPVLRDTQPLRWVHPHDTMLAVDDRLPGLRSADGAAGPPLWLELQAGKLAVVKANGAPRPRVDRLLVAWLRCLVSAACGCPAAGLVIGDGAAVHLTPPAGDAAAAVLADLLLAHRQGLHGERPLPTAVATGLALLADPAGAQSVFEGGSHGQVPGEGREPCLARLFPDFASLHANPDFVPSSQRLYAAYGQWLDNHTRVELLAAAPVPPGAGDA